MSKHRINTDKSEGIGAYFRHIGEAASTLLHGLTLTWRHLLQARKQRKPIGIEQDNYFKQQTGIVTLQYPNESLPVPDNARYRLHNEIEDCIVCDKCAKICPVDCIDIEPIKAVETFGQTSDGTPKRLYAAKFDIDMAKCCFCGLCTTVCPTECLTMTKVYDFSEYDVADHTYAFAEMTPLEILKKRKEQEEYQQQKAAAKAASSSTAARPAMPKIGGAKPGAAKPAMPRPATAKPAESPQETARKLMEKQQEEKAAASEKAATAPNPVAKSAPAPADAENTAAPAAQKPVFKPRPMVKSKTVASAEGEAKKADASDAATSAPNPRPVMKPVVKKPAIAATDQASAEEQAAATPARPRPVMKPVIKKQEAASAAEAEAPKSTAKPRPVVKPLIKKADPAAASTTSAAEDKPPKPIIKPMLSEEDAQANEAKKSGDNLKRPRPVVKPKVVVRKPKQEDKTTEEKQQEDKLRPGPPDSPR